ncbi:hypothetical protein [Paenibacillus mesotrionivorans]|uniref:Uncharacterized protein n=1 Tax=Paenibacillus mesotrionivorans TaxID=3160968 RepID=A0ACC7NVA1_9BACL
MKKITIVYNYEDIDYVNGGTVACQSEEAGYLITPNIAVSTCLRTLFFLHVVPSAEGVDLYDDNGILCEIDLLNTESFDITSIPVEAALSFAMWAAGENVAILSNACAAPIAV